MIVVQESKLRRLLEELRTAAHHVLAAGQVALEAVWEPGTGLVERSGVPNAVIRLGNRIITAARRGLGLRERPKVIGGFARRLSPSRDEFEQLKQRVAALERRLEARTNAA